MRRARGSHAPAMTTRSTPPGSLPCDRVYPRNGGLRNPSAQLTAYWASKVFGIAMITRHLSDRPAGAEHGARQADDVRTAR